MSEPLDRFHRWAELRKKNRASPNSFALDGLDFRLGGGEYIKRNPRIDKKVDSGLGLDGNDISVFEAGQPDGPFVVVWVSPRVYGTFLDPAEPGEDYYRELREEIRSALLSHRILYVQVVPGGRPMN